MQPGKFIIPVLILGLLDGGLNVNICRQSLSLGPSGFGAKAGSDGRLAGIQVDQIFLDESPLSER